MNQPVRPLERVVDRNPPPLDPGWSLSHTGHAYGYELIIFPMGGDRGDSAWNIRVRGAQGSWDGVWECSIEEARRLAVRVAQQCSEAGVPF